MIEYKENALLRINQTTYSNSEQKNQINHPKDHLKYRRKAIKELDNLCIYEDFNQIIQNINKLIVFFNDFYSKITDQESILISLEKSLFLTEYTKFLIFRRRSNQYKNFIIFILFLIYIRRFY